MDNKDIIIKELNNIVNRYAYKEVSTVFNWQTINDLADNILSNLNIKEN